MTERVELAGELDRDELRAATLAPGDEMQDPQGRHRATAVDAGPDPREARTAGLA